jgi:hypothetical protein
MNVQEIEHTLTDIKELDCGSIAEKFIKDITGRDEEVSSRIVRGVEELHRVLRFNMLENAGEGDIIRATLLWAGPFIDDTSRERTMKFIQAAENGAEIRYLVTTDLFSQDMEEEKLPQLQRMMGLVKYILDLRERGKKFDARIYQGPKTYNQISLNTENMALVIAEDPPTATWITRQFNPDLIDNAVKTFDKQWENAKSILSLKPEDFKALGVPPEGLIRKVLLAEDVEEV